MTNPVSSQPQGKPPPGKLALAPSEIHVWRIGLDAPQSALASAKTLSPDELQRARHFAFERDAQRFVRRRIALRRILAGYTGVDAGELRFTCEGSGKPCLLRHACAETVAFNVSHAGGLALIAVCKDRPVGVDVEIVRPLNEMTAIAAHFFSQGERAALANLPAEQQTQAFFNGWTRKEALLKALGHGLSVPLERFEVSLGPPETARVLSVDGDEVAAAGWSLTVLQPAPGYRAAVAVESTRGRLTCWEYSVSEDHRAAIRGTRRCA